MTVPSSRTVGLTAAVVLVVTLALNLRPSATGVGPVMERVTEALGQGSWADGLLTALPCLCFGLLGLAAVPIARRIGLTGTIATAFLVAAAGIVLRSLAGSLWTFLLFYVIALAGPALGNVVAPAWIKRHGGRWTVVLMTLYSALLGLGGTLGSALAVPHSQAGLFGWTGSDGWRGSLVSWAPVALLPVVVACVLLCRTGNDFPRTAPAESTTPASVTPAAAIAQVPLRRSSTAVMLTLMFGLQSMNAYTQFGMLPQIYTAAGVTASVAGALTAEISALGIVGGIIMPAVLARARRLAVWTVSFGLLNCVGYAGLIVAPAGPSVLWATVLGIGGFAFPTAIAMITARARTAHTAARLSGMVQPAGYLVAAIGPLLLGVVLDLIGSMTLVLVLLIVSSLALSAAGWRVSTPHMVDDELTEFARTR